MFNHVEPYGGDPILTLNEDFQKDPRTDKINLSIGVYFDDANRLPVLKAAQTAESALLDPIGPRPYLPISGLDAYRQATQHLLFGADHPAVQDSRIATLQTLGGSGALRIGGEFLKRYFPASELWLSDPTWPNHRDIFESCGLKVHTYPYYDAATGGLRFDEMLAALDALPARSIVLLHACCHNPTGVDLNTAQWDRLIPVLRKRDLIAFVDIAYQGFKESLDDDAYAVRALASAGVTTLVANSFSKNFSLYGERVGGLSVVCANAEEATRVLGQLSACVRRSYSTPPTHGAKIVSRVLTTPELHRQWVEELGSMRERMQTMRQRLHDMLKALRPQHDFGFMLRQNGMFSYTGLSPQQVDALRAQHGVYLVRSGRLCIAGLNTHNLEAVARAWVTVG